MITDDQFKAMQDRQQVQAIALTNLCMRVQEDEVPIKVMEDFVTLSLETVAANRELMSALFDKHEHNLRLIQALMRDGKFDQAREDIRVSAAGLFRGIGIGKRTSQELNHG